MSDRDQHTDKQKRLANLQQHMARANHEEGIQAAREAGFKGVGVYDNSLHFDVGPPRAWGSDYTRNTVPDWARSYVR